MTQENRRVPTWRLLLLILVVGVPLLVFIRISFFRPDQPVAVIVPGTSSEPTFVVQIIRPRLGLPLGGLLPPQLFGLEEHIGFDSSTEGATADSVSAKRVELRAEGWEMVLAVDERGRVTNETHVEFDLMFEDKLRRVRCRPGEPIIGSVKIINLENTGELAGSFDIELADCEDAESGAPLGWPPEPFVLHGSFDRLPIR